MRAALRCHRVAIGAVASNPSGGAVARESGMQATQVSQLSCPEHKIDCDVSLFSDLGFRTTFRRHQKVKLLPKENNDMLQGVIVFVRGWSMLLSK